MRLALFPLLTLLALLDLEGDLELLDEWRLVDDVHRLVVALAFLLCLIDCEEDVRANLIAELVAFRD